MARNWLQTLSRIFWGDESDDYSFDDYEEGPLAEIVSRADAHGRTEVMAGSIQMLGLSLVRDRLGEKWESVSARAADIARTEIERCLGSGDFYQTVDDGYLLCLDTDDHQAAEAVVSRIAKAIEARLIAEIIETEGSAAVRYFTAKVSTADIKSGRFRTTLDQTKGWSGKGTPVRETTSVARAGVVFQPTWTSRDFGSTKNRCIMDSSSGGLAARRLASLKDAESLTAAIADMDCKLFAKCTAVLKDCDAAKRPVMLMVPVQFRTLTGRHRMEFVKVGRTLPAPLRKSLLLDIIGVPESADDRDVRNALHLAAQVTDRAVLQLPPFDPRIDGQTIELLWGVSINLTDAQQNPALTKELQRICQHAGKSGLHTFAYGANTIGKATIARDAGVDYIAGHAVHETQDEPHSQSRFNPLFGRASRTMGDGHLGKRAHPRFAPVNPNATIALGPDKRVHCRVLNASCSGVAVTTSLRPDTGTEVRIGSIDGKVVRHLENGFAIQFDAVHPSDTLEESLASVPVDIENVSLMDLVGQMA